MLPPGRLRLVTSPEATGSAPSTNRVGIEVLAAFTSCTAWSVTIHRHLALDQIGGKRSGVVAMTFGIACFDRDIPTLDEARLVESLAQPCQRMCGVTGGCQTQKPDRRHCLLGSRHPRSCRKRERSTEQSRRKVAPSHLCSQSSTGPTSRPKAVVVTSAKRRGAELADLRCRPRPYIASTP